ncbi:uncharacterized protein [Clytia hemisphaerica]|uniref:uncharacterized protein isoform X2 n=1 Tax=Clytia hemisphaerica TaxID=252671 RepID=UPI0034D6C155
MKSYKQINLNMKKILFLLLMHFALFEAAKIEESNTTVGDTVYHVKKVAFRRYDNVMPTSDANTHQSIREITNATSQVCGTECYRATSCWSFLLFRHKTPPTCTLIDGPIDRRYMIKNSTVDYYEVWNQCSSNNTICNLGICLPNYVTDSYTCHCPSRYTGANCETQIITSATSEPATTTPKPVTTTSTFVLTTPAEPLGAFARENSIPAFTYANIPDDWQLSIGLEIKGQTMVNSGEPISIIHLVYGDNPSNKHVLFTLVYNKHFELHYNGNEHPIQSQGPPLFPSGPFEPSRSYTYNVIFEFTKSLNKLSCTIKFTNGPLSTFTVASAKDLDISPVYDLTNVELYVGYPDHSKYTGEYNVHDVVVTTVGISNLV